MTQHLVLLLAYSALQVGLGLWIGRRVRGAKDFFVAGRSLGPGLLFSTMLAANIGAGSTVGATGLGYRDGLAAWWWVGSAAVGSAFLAFFIGPAIRRVAEKHDLRTVGDYLEFRYDRSIRAAVALLLWVGSLAILAGQLIAIAWILNVVAGLPKWTGCLIGGLVITIYFTAGGLLTSAWVNMVQLTVKLVGFAVAVPMALHAVGGWEAVRAVRADHPSYWSFWQGGASGIVYLALLGPAFVISPGLLQKIYGARDDRAVRLGVGLNALGLFLYAIVPVLMGMIARVRFPDLPTHELALPTLLTGVLPPAIGSLGLAAVFSAEVSSADAVLFMLTTSLSQDLYRRFVNPSATDVQVLRVTRLAAVVAGAAGVALAVVSPTVIGVLSIFYTLLGVSLFVPVVGGLYLGRLGTPEAAAAIVGGIAALVAVQTATGGAGWLGLTPAMIGLASAIVAGCVVLAVRRSDARAGA